MPDLHISDLSQSAFVPTLAGGESEDIPQMDYFRAFLANLRECIFHVVR